MSVSVCDYKSFIRDVPDYPKKGITFKDITPLLSNANAFSSAVKAMVKPFENHKISKVVCVEARGFIFGAAIANYLGVGFTPVRKLGKLPYKTNDIKYDLEYGQDTLSIHQDALTNMDSVLIVDDLLATGGTVLAAVKLIEDLGATIVGASFLIDLSFLGGRAKMPPFQIETVLEY
ncbi:MAG: adenine phosphoribosyltransferase [Candidatus Omnitrophota bacterium]|jgi:adenine phosphoribosyltransferase